MECSSKAHWHVARLIETISEHVCNVWGSNYIPAFTDKAYPVIIPSSIRDKEPAYDGMIKANASKFKALDGRISNFIRKAIIKSLAVGHRDIIDDTLCTCKSGIETWHKVYKEVYLRTEAAFSAGYSHAGI